jgi:hypothetical protein
MVNAVVQNVDAVSSDLQKEKTMKVKSKIHLIATESLNLLIFDPEKNKDDSIRNVAGFIVDRSFDTKNTRKVVTILTDKNLDKYRKIFEFGKRLCDPREFNCPHKLKTDLHYEFLKSR